jgi:thymidine kinase
MQDKYNTATDKCLKEMFKRVGEKYPNHELTKDEGWFTKRTWSIKEQDTFIVWMSKFLKKQFGWNAKKIENEVGMFVLYYGWKTNDPKAS